MFKHYFQRLVIKQKLMLMHLLVVGSAMSMVFVLTLVYQYMSYKAELTHDLRSHLSLVESNVGAAVAFNDAKTAHEVLTTLQLNPNIVSADLTLKNGQRFSQFKAINHVGDQHFNWLPIHGREIKLVKPVIVNQETLATLSIVANLSSVNERIVMFAFGLFIAVILAMLFANLMSEKLSHYITEPISYLKGLVSNITEKQNYGERSHLQSDDEIGALATGINSMLDNIKIRDDQLVNELAQRLVIEQKLDQLAYYDSQTKLPNRHAFTEHIHQLMGIGSQPNAHFYLLLLDLDYFKTVNDTYGHEAGDELLTQCGHRLRRILNEQDTVYRIGGDEFAIVLKAVKSIKDVETICQRIIKAVSQKFLIHTHEVYIGTSIGIAQFSKDKSRDSQLIKHADTAMYWAKAAGKNTYKFYSEEIEQANYYQQKLNLDLQDALKKQQFELYYQPIIHVETQAIIGFEALLRWHHPQQGYISPNIFIPMAETNGLIIQIGDWVIKAALKQLAHWQTQYHPLIFMNINISAKQFFDKRILDTVRLTLKNQQLDPSTVHFELTESILMEDVGKSTQVMRALRDMGTGIAVDDFGTGHSSMRYLKQFPINTIKVDKCFVRGLPTDTVDTAIVDAIFALAKSLKLDIVAEGVETQEQVDYLRKLGCKKVQGFFFNRPITVEEVELLLQASVQENPLIQ